MTERMDSQVIMVEPVMRVIRQNFQYICKISNSHLKIHIYL